MKVEPAPRPTARSWRIRALLLLAVPVWALAQSGGSYTLRKQVIASGVVATGGSYRLTGTVGQAVAAVQSGGSFRLTGGFHGPRASSDRLLCNGFENTGCP